MNGKHVLVKTFFMCLASILFYANRDERIMMIPTTNLETIERELLNGQTVFVPTGSVYESVRLSQGLPWKQDWPSVTQTDSTEIYHCLLSGKNQLSQLVPEINFRLQRLVDSLSPGPVSFLTQIKSPQGPRKILFHIPTNQTTLKLITKLNQPLWVTPAAGLPMATLDMLQTGQNGHSVYALDDSQTNLGLEPVILDVRRIHRGKVDILRPGMWDWRELSQIDEDLLIKEKFQSSIPAESKYKLVPDINQIKPSGLKLLLGTKEDLIREFGYGLAHYFRLQEQQDFLLLNLGSLANPASILKNLYKNINLAGLLGFQEIYILQPTLHRPYHLRRTLEFILNQNATPAGSAIKPELPMPTLKLPSWILEEKSGLAH
jgi:tRNA A37 threonylcarbamoyladenosine synthetase subunit TsaC/SUA5/YrdC